nr:PREDICTED: protein SIEVE ELEMENT OCCLUSION B-like isoform X3 [Daucus carota subsp. sativus]
MAAIVQAGSARMQQASGNRILFSMSDENVMMDQILSTHCPDGREFHVQPLFLVIEDVMHRANAPLPGTIFSATLQGTQAQLDEKAPPNCFSDILKLLGHTIKKTSLEISYKRSEGGNAQATTVSLFDTLSIYPWDVKVVVVLAAFTLIYGEFWLVEELCPTNPLAKAVAHLKQLPEIMGQAESLKPNFESLDNLIKAVLDLTKCIVDFKCLPSQDISPDTPEMVTAPAHIPIAAYWTIRSIVACAFIVINHIGSSHEYFALTTEAWELSSLTHKVNNIHTNLKKQFSLCQQHIAIVSAASARMLQSIGDRIFFSTSDDNVMMDQILSTHSPDGRKFHVQPLSLIIEDVMHRSNAPLLGTIISTTHRGTWAQLDETSLHSCFSDILKLLALTIKKISCEITCKCSGEENVHATTMSLFNTLSIYPWDVKVVVALAAFVLIHDEFCLVARLYPTNPLAKSVAHLKQLPHIMEQAETLKSNFESLGNLIKAVLDLTKRIVDFKCLPSQYISPDTLEMVTATAHIPIAVYWTIRSIVACAFIVINLIGSSHEYFAFTTEEWELSSLTRKVNNIHAHLKEQLSLCYQHIDDNVMMNQILSTHSPDNREFHVQPLFLIIEDVMHHANAPLSSILSTTLQGTHAQLEGSLHNGYSDILKLLAHAIKKSCCEITCKCSGGGDAQATTVALFNTLSIYPWDVKVVVALVAFVMIHDEFCQVAQLCPTYPLAKSVAHLKQLPDKMEPAESLEPKFESLGKLVKAVLDLTKCIVEFKSLLSQSISLDIPEMVTATARIPVAVYWTIRSIVACAFVVTNLTGISHECLALTTEAWELNSLAHKVNNIHSHLNKQLSLCHHHIDMMKNDEAYKTLVRMLETPHIDNTKFLKALIYPKDDQLPLYDGYTRRRVSIETLRRKIVLLFITEFDILQEEIILFGEKYKEAKQNPSRAESHFEVVWLPITDRSVPWNEEKQLQFYNTQDLMPWQSLHHPSMLDPVAIKYIKDKWHFTKKSIAVVLDQQGKVVNLNALHMMWIWGNLAYPFTSLKEEQLWNEESWNIEFLVNRIDTNIFKWINEGKYICLYGGVDIDWIRKFTVTANTVAWAAGIQLKMIYVGKSNSRDKIQKITTTIVAKNLSYVWRDLTLIWFFWSRIESMWHSRVQHGKSVENDQIMKEIMTMLYFDGDDQGWAVIGQGMEMAKAKGEMFLKSLSEFDEWKHDSDEKGFLPALNDYFKKLYTPHHCHRFTFPGSTGSVHDNVVCAECGRPMEKSTMYTCCTD